MSQKHVSLKLSPVRLRLSAPNCPLRMREKELNSVKFLKEIDSSPSTGHILTLRSGNHRFEDRKDYRNFYIGDRVKVFFKDEWCLGKIVDKYFKKRHIEPYIMVKTDKKVEDDRAAYLNGFGIEASMANEFHTLFIKEKPPGKKIYRTNYKYKFNSNEEKILKKQDKEDEENWPF